MLRPISSEETSMSTPAFAVPVKRASEEKKIPVIITKKRKVQNEEALDSEKGSSSTAVVVKSKQHTVELSDKKAVGASASKKEVLMPIILSLDKKVDGKVESAIGNLGALAALGAYSDDSTDDNDDVGDDRATS